MGNLKMPALADLTCG